MLRFFLELSVFDCVHLCPFLTTLPSPTMQTSFIDSPLDINVIMLVIVSRPVKSLSIFSEKVGWLLPAPAPYSPLPLSLNTKWERMWRVFILIVKHFIQFYWIETLWRLSASFNNILLTQMKNIHFSKTIINEILISWYPSLIWNYKNPSRALAGRFCLSKA